MYVIICQSAAVAYDVCTELVEIVEGDPILLTYRPFGVVSTFSGPKCLVKMLLQKVFKPTVMAFLLLTYGPFGAVSSSSRIASASTYLP